jgi:hypothetical protein
LSSEFSNKIKNFLKFFGETIKNGVGITHHSDLSMRYVGERGWMKDTNARKSGEPEPCAACA